MQPKGEICSNKSKRMKGNERKKAFISFQQFFRIGTFQRVTPKKIKNSSARSTRATGCKI
jgi:hypothetical protein